MMLKSSFWALALLAVLTACAVPQLAVDVSTPGLVITAEAGGRTLLPTLPAGATYAITVTPTSTGKAVTTTQSVLSTPITGLPPGAATLSVQVKTSAGALLAQSATQAITLNGSHTTNVSIVLDPVGSGSGQLDLTVNWPPSRLTSVHAWLYTLPYNPPSTVNYVGGVSFMSPGNTYSTVFTQKFTGTGTPPAIPAGTYLLQVAMTGQASAPFPDYTAIVQIWPGLTTTASVNITDAMLTQVPAAPSNVQYTQDGQSVTVTWTDNSDTESGFKLYRSGILQYTTSPGVNIYHIAYPDLITNWAVSAFNALGESSAVAGTPLTYAVGPLVTVPDLKWVPIGDPVQAPPVAPTPAHVVSSLRTYDIGKTEVTYGDWRVIYNWAVTKPAPTYAFGHPGANPGSSPDYPVSSISWRDMVVWCNALSEAMGRTPVYYTDAGFTQVLRVSTNSAFTPSPPLGTEDNPYIKLDADGYRLPTEAEWEAAARYQDGVQWGDPNAASGAASSSIADTDAVGWFGTSPHPVGLKPANGLGLYDMAGNMLELVQDWFNGYYSDDNIYTAADTTGASTSGWDARVARGGASSYSTNSNSNFTSARDAEDPAATNSSWGFRLARGVLGKWTASTVSFTPSVTLSNPSYLDVGPSGRLLLIDEAPGPQGKVTGFDASGSVFENFSAPTVAHGLAFVGSAIYTADTSKVYPFTGTAPSFTQVATPYGGGVADDTSLVNVAFTSVGALARGPNGSLLTVDQATGAIKQLNLAANTVSTLYTETVNAPQGLVYDPVRQRIYLADTGTSRVMVYSDTGTALGSYYGTGISGPIGLAVDGTGRTLYVVNSLTNVVTLLDTTSTAPGGTKAAFPFASGLSNPHGIAVAADGTVYVADTGNNRVLKITP